MGRYEHQCLLYADDLVLLTRRKKHLQQVFERKECSVRKKVLEMNAQKTKVMTLRSDNELVDGHLRITDNLTYLGVLINDKN